MSNDTVSDELASKLLVRALAANDHQHQGWPKEAVEHAIWLWNQSQGSVPSLTAVTNYVGRERAEKMLPDLLASRKFHNVLIGHGSSCHYCRVEKETIQSYDFALMQVQETSRKWGETAASATLSLVTLPLLGGVMIRGPSKVHSGAALHLRLIACQKCRSANANILGLFMLNETRASKHPAWEKTSRSRVYKIPGLGKDAFWNEDKDRARWVLGANNVCSLRPNPSLKGSTNGGPPGPAWRYAVHFRQAGPGVPPSAPP